MKKNLYLDSSKQRTFICRPKLLRYTFENMENSIQQKPTKQDSSLLILNDADQVLINASVEQLRKNLVIDVLAK